MHAGKWIKDFDVCVDFHACGCQFSKSFVYRATVRNIYYRPTQDRWNFVSLVELDGFLYGSDVTGSTFYIDNVIE
jgi:hypothetical protein